MKFQYQITIFFIIVAILPLSVFSYVMYNDARDSLIFELSEQLSFSADLTRDNLIKYMDEAEDNLNVLSTTDVVLNTFLDIENNLNDSGEDIILFSNSPEYNRIMSNVDSYLTRFLEIENEYSYDNIYFINKEGTIIYSKTKYSDFGTNLINGPYSNTLFGKTVKKSIDGQSSSMSNIENYEPLNNIEAIFFAEPVFIGENNFHGIIVFQIPFLIIDKIISDPIGLSGSGESVLAKRDDNGDAMFISSLKHVFSKSEQRISKDRLNVPITQALLKNEKVILDAIDYRNVSVIAATRYIESMDWGLVVKEDASDAFSSIYAFRDSFVLTIIIVGGLTSICSIVLSFRIVRPLKKLEENMMNIEETHEIVDQHLLSKKDEIGYLANTFSKMLQKHKESDKKIVSAEKLASIGMIAGTLSHEIRNPLGTISNAIYLLNMNKEKLDEKTIRQLKIIQLETERMNVLISEFYSFAKVNQLNKVSESLNNVINDVLETHKFPENISVKTVLHQNLPKTLIDFNKMRQVFINIIDNAVSAMPDGGKIDISSDIKNKDIIIKISDTGKGIPEDEIGLIFEPLYTTKSSGLGLGLAVVKKIVESHNGVIEVESEKDKGTTFKILFKLG